MITAFTSTSPKVSRSYQKHGEQLPILDELARREASEVFRAWRRKGSIEQLMQGIAEVMVMGWSLIKKIYARGGKGTWPPVTRRGTIAGAEVQTENTRQPGVLRLNMTRGGMRGAAGIEESMTWTAKEDDGEIK